MGLGFGLGFGSVFGSLVDVLCEDLAAEIEGGREAARAEVVHDHAHLGGRGGGVALVGVGGGDVWGVGCGVWGVGCGCARRVLEPKQP